MGPLHGVPAQSPAGGSPAPTASLPCSFPWRLHSAEGPLASPRPGFCWFPSRFCPVPPPELVSSTLAPPPRTRFRVSTPTAARGAVSGDVCHRRRPEGSASGRVKAEFIPGDRPPEPGPFPRRSVDGGLSGACRQGSVAASMDSVPATVPSVTASQGDPELLGPLSVLYAALFAKLLEVTAPFPGRDSRFWPAGGRVASGVGGCLGWRAEACVRPKAGQDVACCALGPLKKPLSPVHFMVEHLKR